jgi:hypothetical protein
MEQANLTNLHDLLVKGYTVAQLATTIERYGVTGWDRFGRFRDFSPREEGASEALNFLAKFSEFEARFYAQRDLANLEDVASGIQDLSRAIDVLEGLENLALERFGWPPGKVPPIDKGELYPPAPTTHQPQASVRGLLTILGALLDFCGTLTPKVSTNQIIDALIVGKYKNALGISKSNLKKQFSSAKKVVQEANQ